MTVLRCTARLLKRLNLPARPAEPEPQSNPLGEWYADFDHCRRVPVVILFNPATGVVLALPGRFDGLRRLNELAALAFCAVCIQYEVGGPALEDELRAFAAGFAFATTRDRSARGSLALRTTETLLELQHGRSLLEASSHAWEGLCKSPASASDKRNSRDYHRPLDMLRQRLMPTAPVHPLRPDPSLQRPPAPEPGQPPAEKTTQRRESGKKHPATPERSSRGSPGSTPRDPQLRLVSPSDAHGTPDRDDPHPTPVSTNELFPRNTELLLYLYQAHEDRSSDDVVKIPAKWLLDALQRANLEMMRIKGSDHFPLMWGRTDYVAFPANLLVDHHVPLLNKLVIETEDDDEPPPEHTQPARRGARKKGTHG